MARLCDWLLVISVQFLSFVTGSGAVGLEIRVVVHVSRDLTVIRSTCREDDLLVGVLEDGAREIDIVHAFEGYLEVDAEEVLLESDDMVIIGCARDFH